jgi:hypothetical protein
MLAVADKTIDSGDVTTIAAAVVRALGYAVPRAVFCGRELSVRPPMPWSPFSLSL